LSEELRNLIFEKFYLSIFREEEEAPKEPEISVPVTGLIYECLRRCVYQIIIPESLIDPQGAIRVWIGRKLHENRILDKSEKELELTWTPKSGEVPIKGRIDEYADGIILDIKTTRRIPREVYPHHVTQLEYYKILLEENGRPVKEGAILYIDVDRAEVQVFPVEFNRSSDEIKAEMLTKYEIISKCIESRILPPRKVRTWEERGITTICSYCSYFARCMMEDYDVSREPLRWRLEREIE